MRKTKFSSGEYYHIFNRGVDKREIFSDNNDLARFFQSMSEFNTKEPIGSIFENSFRDSALGGRAAKSKKLVNFICFCLNPNHYHFVLEQVADNGIQKFMHRLGGGYTWYFNNKNKRNGVLFQGKYKSVHIGTNEYLLHMSAYVNLNNKVHQLGGSAAKLTMSSWKEYFKNDKEGFCNKEIILRQFNGTEEYKNFAGDSLRSIREKKEMEKILLE